MIVSLCVIAFNEEKSIKKLLNDIICQDYNHKNIELVFVDNQSTDKTLQILNKFKINNQSFMNIKICTCSKHIQAACWNVAIENASGDIIIRVDAHSSIPPSFVKMNVLTISDGEDVCGGGRPNRIEFDTPWQNTLLTVEEYLFGNFAVYRKKSSKKQYVDSVFHACYKRDVFKKVGGFNESLGRTEDNEFHYRVRLKGYKICMSNNIISYQNIRSSLPKMIKQKFSNGLWIGLTLGVCPKCLSYLYLVPFLLVLSYIFCFALFLLNLPVLLYLLSIFYSLFVLAITISAFIKNKFHLQFLFLPIIFPVMHFSYGIGTLIGLIKMPFWKNSIDKKIYDRIDDIKNKV